jgi:ABC-type cobalamin/Fe3+-siderophores transport system ATPase subunit
LSAAVQNNRVIPFNDDLVSRPGPRMIEGLEEMARIFHPDLFPIARLPDPTSTARPYWLALIILAAALLFSVMVGSVFISPGDAVHLLKRNCRAEVHQSRTGPFATSCFPAPAAHRADRHDRRGPGRQRRGVPGSLSQPAGRPVPDRGSLGRGIGRGDPGHEHELALHHPGAAGRTRGGFRGRAADRFYRLSTGAHGAALPVTNLILAGVAVSSFATALTSFLMLNSHRRAAPRAGLAAGRLDPERVAAGAGPAAVLAGGLGVLMTTGHALNVMQFGDEQAQQLGLPVTASAGDRHRRLADHRRGGRLCGIIGFVGLIVPHMVRMLGRRLPPLLPLSLLGGAALLLLADVLARVLMAPQELPVGMIMALAARPSSSGCCAAPANRTCGVEMLEVSQLSVRYDQKQVLKDVHLRLEAGKILAVIGPNGAGKSTLVRAISGIIPVETGRIRMDGRDLDQLPPHERARLIAVVPQVRQLPPAFSAWQVVLLGRTPYLNWLGQVSARDEEIVRQAMTQTRTLELASRQVSELSGGELQRLLLARALVQTTPVMLLDEPTTHLDLHYQISLLNQVQELVHQPSGASKENGHSTPPAILVVLHDLNLVARYADQVLLLVDGQVRASGSQAEVLRPELLSEAFGIPLEVTRSPNGNFPIILPLMA